jgi:hypothetical protein
MHHREVADALPSKDVAESDRNVSKTVTRAAVKK